MRSRLLPVLLLSLSLVLAAAPTPRTLVVCAPGFPGDTTEAQPTMDAFAKAVEGALGRKDVLRAVYYATEAEGVDALRRSDAALAMVTLPFLQKHRVELGLQPRLSVVQESGATETWSLVAKKGTVGSAAALDGFEIVGVPAFAPEFVRGPILGAWGALPPGARITFTSRVNSALLRAAAGERVAVLLDRAQTKALATHPNGADLEVVATSPELPGNLVCTLRGRTGKDVDALVRALTRVPTTSEARAILSAMRVTRFEPIDAATLQAALGDRPAAARK